MKWKLNRRRQFTAGQDAHAPPLSPPSPFASLAPHWEASYKCFTAVRNVKTRQHPHNFETWQMHTPYAYCIYQHTQAQTWCHVPYTPYAYSIYQETGAQTWKRILYKHILTQHPILCFSLTLIDNIPNSCRYHLQVHAPTLSSSSVCLKQEMRWESTATTQQQLCIVRAALYLPTPALATYLCSKMATPTLWCSRVPCVKADQTLSMSCCVTAHPLLWG